LTDEELQRFWEWCGIKGRWVDDGRILRFPKITLNNLFRYAVPELDQAQYYKALSSIFLKQDDPAQALYQAIKQVMEAEHD